MKVISFYTEEYAGEAQPFLQSAIQHGHEPLVRVMNSRKSWRLNCGLKVSFILECLMAAKEPVLWVDIDARFRAPFDLDAALWGQDVDFAAWFIPYAIMKPADVPGGPDTENDGIASGTLWFNWSDGARELLRQWQSTEKGQGTFEQKVLGEVWYSRARWWRGGELRTFRLPQRYCKVYDHDWVDGEEEGQSAVIEHMQASRKLRNKVG